MTKIINSRFEMPGILKVLVDAIADEIVQADLVGFFLKQPDGTYRGYTGNKLPVDITELVIDPAQDEFAKYIILNKASDYISDTSKDQRADPAKLELLKIKSILGLPVIVDDDVIGLVFVHDFGKPMDLTVEQREVTEAFVNMASVAIRNIQMFEQTQDLLNRQQLLLDLTNALSKSLSINDVLSTCFHYMKASTGCGDIGIHLYNEQERILTPYHLSSTSHFTEEEWKGIHKQGIQLHIDKDLLFHEVITTKKAVAIPDVFADPRPNHEACKSFGIQSMILIPLVANGKVFGAVAIPDIHKKKVYTDNEIDFIQSICDVTATALSNAIYAENLDLAVKQRTAELQQANLKLEELVKELRYLNDLKSDFIASLSHELRTPITAIKGTIDIFKRGILGELNAGQRDLIETSNTAVERLLDQVNELLDFAKLENGKFELMSELVNFKDIVDEAVRILTPLTEKKKQTIQVKSEVQRSLKLDKQRILQVLLNLLYNANKFTPEGGEIAIEIGEDHEKIQVEVRDTGIGIPTEKQKYIFQKFYQVNNQLRGTGLGLAISKQLIELHKGSIWFSSIEGKGSVFSFTLPIGGENHESD
ncbi:GAF domain-containing sensor histidine kinase [Ferviditalea candida]|uniref:histidine kinase n=1 Tax=Ferviditalea candida TaxID=3108399 RepID=A0ABU5ZH09_9BACL|nr:ATP-binding protein [Paenibacillaceae bacterium T2]